MNTVALTFITCLAVGTSPWIGTGAHTRSIIESAIVAAELASFRSANVTKLAGEGSQAVASASAGIQDAAVLTCV